MESKEAECILADCAMDSEDENDALVIAVCDAEEAIEAAERDMKKKAIEAFRRFTEDYCLESGRTDISNDSEHYVKVFNELIDE